MRTRITTTLILCGPILVPPSHSPASSQTASRIQTEPKPVRRAMRFERRLLLEKTSETSANISFGDVDADGKLDVVLAKGRHWPLVDRVMLGDGHGRITSAYDLSSVADRSYSARLVDMDGDGDLDLVVSNDMPDPKVVYLNDGKGHFQLGTTFGQPEWETRNASVADLNSDGRPDIVVANRGDHSSNFICLNRPNGRFECSPFANYPATTITPADFNGDGLIDLAVPHRDGGQSYIYLNQGSNGGFSDSRRIPFGPPDATIRMAETADFNHDGQTDLVTIDERTGTAIYFRQNDGTFSPGLVVGDPKKVPYALAVGDLDLDGNVDIVVGYVKARPAIFFSDSSGRHFTPTYFGDKKGTVYGFAIGDLDHDGNQDIGVARSKAQNVVYFGSH